MNSSPHPTGNYVCDGRFPLDFSRGEDASGCSVTVLEYLKTTPRIAVVQYPDNLDGNLFRVIAEKWRLTPDHVMIGNGSLGVLCHIMRFAAPRFTQCVTSECTFPSYRILAEQHNMRCRTVPLRADWQQDLVELQKALQVGGTLCILANPNNPTGILEPDSRIREFIAVAHDAPRSLLVLDEANAEYCGSNAFSRMERMPQNVISVHSFSKAYGLAGLRVGYAIAHPDLIRRIAVCHQDFPVAQVAQDAAAIALSDQGHIARSVAAMRRARRFLAEGMTECGMGVVRSDSNFLIADIRPVCPSIPNFLDALSSRGVHVLSGERFRGLPSSFIRVTPRTQPENEGLLAAIRAACHYPTALGAS